METVVTSPPQPDAVGRVEKGLFPDGRWRSASGGGSFSAEDPATGRTLCEVSAATPADALAALDAASAAQAKWAAVSPRRRRETLRRAHDLLIERMDEFALLITLWMGKSLAESWAEAEYGANHLRWFGEEAARIDGSWKVSEEGTARVLVTRQPVGPCLLITPR